MAKKELSLDELDLVKIACRRELENILGAMDEVNLSNLREFAKTADANIKNIMRLQAQVTALKDCLVERGVITRDRIVTKENEALARLERVATHNDAVAAGAATA